MIVIDHTTKRPDVPALYFGRKLVKAVPMTKEHFDFYIQSPNPAAPIGELPVRQAPGYMVEYLDGGRPNDPRHTGYISWCPKEAFENANQDVNEGVDFGAATFLAKRGFRVARKGWNGKGMFVYVVDPGEYPAKMDAIKNVFPEDKVPYGQYWAIKTAQGPVVPWAPSSSDSLAEDWVIVEGGSHAHQ
ncbi:DUF2829 domain-containing protein [Pseudoalteromonas rubra]|uniref:DUF2829 domain-containing protein n=1 Tax=Pseudoalteromonas rubra TaxID=43658 RepID=UPI002DBA812E|nr:DUF2829 domain-containing protein [Pseudoalteromonas rubra]MEC4091606.1 DUF2829 domain-containing protein [Pseudoalteromonas rubra]